MACTTQRTLLSVIKLEVEVALALLIVMMATSALKMSAPIQAQQEPVLTHLSLLEPRVVAGAWFVVMATAKTLNAQFTLTALLSTLIPSVTRMNVILQAFVLDNVLTQKSHAIIMVSVIAVRPGILVPLTVVPSLAFALTASQLVVLIVLMVQ